MDELDALRHMRTGLAHEEHPDRIALRTNWRAATPARPRRSRRAPLIGLAAAGTVAAVAAGAAAIVSQDPGKDPASAPRGRQAAPQQGNVLLVAATNALKSPAGRYWHVKILAGEIFAVGKRATDHYRVDSRQGIERWTGSGGNGRQTHLDYADVPLTARDRQKWQAAGSPDWVRIPNHEGGTEPMLLDMGVPGKSPGWYPADKEFLGLTAQQIAKLPTTPKELENALLDLKGHWRAYSSNTAKEPIRALKGHQRVRALSDVGAALLSTAPAPPAVRAAVFRLLAALPGVKPEGRTADPLGRTGTVISLPLETTMPLGVYTAPKQLGTYRRQMIIDPGTGKLLAIRDLVAKPPRGSRPLPTGDNGKPRSLKAENMPDRFHRPGELASYQVYQITEWTNAEPPR